MTILNIASSTIPDAVVLSPRRAHISNNKDKGLASTSSRRKPKRRLSVAVSATASARATATIGKKVSFCEEVQEHAYPSGICTRKDKAAIYATADELQDYRKGCVRTVRSTYRNHPELVDRLVEIFEMPYHSHDTKTSAPALDDVTAADIDMLASGPCRGLEGKLNTVFVEHRRWAVSKLIQLQSFRLSTKQGDEKGHSATPRQMAAFCLHASMPTVHLALLFAAADRQAANDIYMEDAWNIDNCHSNNMYDSRRERDMMDSMSSFNSNWSDDRNTSSTSNLVPLFDHVDF